MILCNVHDFLKKGKALPKLREIAIRFIHAPVLSTFSGFKWTDTTQGIEVIAAGFLFDDISIFRNIFKNMNFLHIFPTSPQEKILSALRPVIRRYPKGKYLQKLIL